MHVIASLINLYMIAIMIRMVLTWIQGPHLHGRFFAILQQICDPYLNWFRRFRAFQTPMMDFSPIIAMAALSVAGNIFSVAARFGHITVGIVLAILLSAVWSFVSFFLGFFIIVCILKLISLSTNRDRYNGFWRIVDLIAQPIVYRINAKIFRYNAIDTQKCIISCGLFLLGIRIVLGILVAVLSGVFRSLPF
jgi:YggT family protein